jgi:activator of HSP90 ATPase
VEKDAIQWSNQRLAELLGGQTVEGCGARVSTAAALSSLTGEAFVNCRKGKLIPAYELELKLAWTGEAGGAAASGLLHLPYIADENAGEPDNLEVRVSATADGAADRACKEALQKLFVPRARAAVAVWVADMARGGPGGGAAPSLETDAAEAALPKKTTALQGVVRPTAEPVDGKATIRLTERFYCRPTDIFEAFTQPGRVRAFTQSECDVSPAPGATFRLFSGNIEGINVEMEPGKLILQQWRFANWPEGVSSTLRIELSEPEHGTTVVQLVQTGVPVADKFGNEHVVETTTTGWTQNFFERIRKVFGWGC